MQLDNKGKALTEEKNDKDMLYAFSCIYPRTSGTCVFIFEFGC